MYGWEFPPRISGGLGVACYAIAKELAERNINLTVVLPELVKTNMANVNIISCNNSALNSSLDSSLDSAAKLNELEFESISPNIKHARVAASLFPYITARDLKWLISSEVLQDFFALLAKMHLPKELKEMAMDTAEICMSDARITGKYGVNLLLEVFRYALVSGALAKNIEHNVIYAHDWLTMLAALEAKRYSNKPVILHIHALETDRSGLWVDKRIFAIEKYGMEQADHIIAVSKYTKQNIMQHYGIPAEKITVVHNGIYQHNALTSAQNTARPKMVLFLGRVTHQKGPYFFIEVARRVLEKRDDVQFVIAGTGDLLLEMIERVASLRLGKNVHFTGFLDTDRVREIYKLADVYVMPSVSEPFGLAALEALANDVPAIISKQSGVTEVLNNTLVSDFWDVDDISAKVLALLDYPVLRRVSLANEKNTLEEITWGKAADSLINVYKKILKY
jgi:glycosyltransferase involved in cell wall biosynthesis